MTDLYQGFAASSIGGLITKNLGLPAPTKLQRYVEGAPLVDGTVAVGGRGRLAESLVGILDTLGIAAVGETDAESTYRGLVFDATGLTSSDQLVALRDFFTPLLRSLDRCPRVVVIGTPPEQVKGSERVAQRALEGFTRSLGKEIGRGGTVQLVYVADGAEGSVASTLAFLLSPKSAYVSGQVVRIGAHGTTKAAGRSPTGPARSRARSPWSPARAEASASRSPACCTATARPSSGSTYPRPPASCRA